MSGQRRLPRDVKRHRALLGSSNWRRSERPPFRGEIADVFVYDRALTLEEVQALMVSKPMQAEAPPSSPF